MSSDLDLMVLDAYRESPNAIYKYARERLTELFPRRTIMEINDHFFRLERFAEANLCDLTLKPGFTSQYDWSWTKKHKTRVDPFTTWHELRWEGHQLEVLSIGVSLDYRRSMRFFLLTESEEVGKQFIDAVCSWNAQVKGAILVFEGGCWHQDPDLLTSISGTKLATLVLNPGLADSLFSDINRFFASEELFKTHGLPWRRGFLLMGPPGNGKTHAIKGLVNELGKPCLYVRNFSSEYGTEEANISTVFERARAVAPCLLILEDVDAMVTEKNRSYFLNELDGFQNNHGILTIASTNHPERLDPAILSRPSRFDRKYTFTLPALEERKRYLASFAEGLAEPLRLDDAGIASVAEATEGFSFAYLKELYASSMMEWVSLEATKPILDVVQGQVAVLLTEMTAEWNQPKPESKAGKTRPVLEGLDEDDHEE